MKRTAGWWMAVVVLATAGSALGQCQGGGGGTASASARGAASVASRTVGSVGMVGSSVNPYAQAMASVGALQQQLAMQQYQKALKDQQNRAERQALRQYWAAQRRQQKAATTSPGELAAVRNSGSSFASLDFSPGR